MKIFTVTSYGCMLVVTKYFSLLKCFIIKTLLYFLIFLGLMIQTHSSQCGLSSLCELSINENSTIHIDIVQYPDYFSWGMNILAFLSTCCPQPSFHFAAIILRLNEEESSKRMKTSIYSVNKSLLTRFL